MVEIILYPSPDLYFSIIFDIAHIDHDWFMTTIKTFKDPGGRVFIGSVCSTFISGRVRGKAEYSVQAAKSRRYFYLLYPRLKLIPGTVKTYPLRVLSSY